MQPWCRNATRLGCLHAGWKQTITCNTKNRTFTVCIKDTERKKKNSSVSQIFSLSYTKNKYEPVTPKKNFFCMSNPCLSVYRDFGRRIRSSGALCKVGRSSWKWMYVWEKKKNVKTKKKAYLLRSMGKKKMNGSQPQHKILTSSYPLHRLWPRQSVADSRISGYLVSPQKINIDHASRKGSTL